jgi:GNAT superfamily N-acetyltransferase
VRPRDLAILLQRNETAAEGGLFTIDPVSVRRMGVGVARRDGVVCLWCREAPIALLHRAIGVGTLGPATQAALDRVLRVYDRLGLAPRVEVAEGIAPRSLATLLRRSGFREEDAGHHVHVLATDRVPDAPAVAGLRLEPATPRTAAEFGRLIRTGFEVDGPLGDYFDRASAVAVRRMPPSRVVSLIARIDGQAAGTGVLWCSPRVGGLYSGSVLKPFRGRGIQKALIAERIRLGLERGRRIFTSQTAGDDASAHNLRDMGFRVLYRSRCFTRP